MVTLQISFIYTSTPTIDGIYVFSIFIPKEYAKDVYIPKTYCKRLFGKITSFYTCYKTAIHILSTFYTFCIFLELLLLCYIGTYMLQVIYFLNEYLFELQYISDSLSLLLKPYYFIR